MALKLSKALRNALLTSSGLKTILEGASGGSIIIFKGTYPSSLSPEAALLQTDVLWTIPNVRMAAAADNGTLAKEANVWSGVPLAGIPTLYRHVVTGDNGYAEDAAESLPRMQGVIGAGGDMFFTGTSFDGVATETLHFHNIHLPESLTLA